MKKQLYGFAILYHKPLGFDQSLQEQRFESSILVSSKEILASSGTDARHLAAMEIPTDKKSEMENIEVLVWKVNAQNY